MKVLEELAEEVDAAWQRTGRSQESFADIATTAMKDADLRSRIDAEQLVRHVQTATFPNQDGENGYGEPAITFARRRDFRVEVIFWMDGVAPIHHHGSTGAFFVLDGERLHATYEFDAKDTTREPGLVLGDLHLRGVELLTAGDLRKIHPGLGYIHSLVFIGRPCLTISVRAVHEAPFHIHLNAHVLADVAAPRTTMSRRGSAFALFLALHPDEGISMGRHVLAHADLLLAESILFVLRPSATDDEYAMLLEVARGRFGEWIDKVIASTSEDRRRRSIRDLIPSHRGREPRILLGLVWAGADATMTRALLARHFPGRDPLALVEEWTRAIRGPRARSEQLSAALGLTPEDEVGALLREFHARLARAA